VKARSMDVASPAQVLFDHVRSTIESSGFKVGEFVDLDPFDKEHGVFIVSRGGEAG